MVLQLLMLQFLLICKDQAANTIRPIYDCRFLNENIRGKQFSLPDIAHFIMLKQPGELFMKIDLTNAYWHFSINKTHRKYLGIKWGGQTFRWTVLPFGLKSAPYIFHKALKNIDKFIAEKLCLKHLRYLDDIL